MHSDQEVALEITASELIQWKRGGIGPVPKNRLTTATAIVLQSLEVSMSLYLQYTLHIYTYRCYTKNHLHIAKNN